MLSRALVRQSLGLLVLMAILATGCSSEDPAGDERVTNSDAASSDDASAGSATGKIDVRFSEIHYHAPGDKEEDEFIELVNRGADEVELQGWCITGVKYCVESSTIIKAGSFIVFPRSSFLGSLSNKSDELKLVDPLGQVLDSVTYLDRSPWPELADGNGHSLQRVNFELDGSDPTAWSSAQPTQGLEFIDDDELLAGEIVITEINFHPENDDPAAQYIELANMSAAPIDLNGWCIEGIDWCWTTALLVDAEATIVLKDPNGLASLSHSSDRLRVVDPDGVVQDVIRYKDQQPWPAMADGRGETLHRRDIAQSGLEPGNWESRVGSPGVSEAVDNAGLIPIVEQVDFELLPEQGVPLVVTAQISTDVTKANLVYRIGFLDEVALPMTIDGSTVAATIPGQLAGSLIRFRVELFDGSTFGFFPRAGDGARYTGTVVASDPDVPTPLTRFQWFIPDDVYDQARGTTSLHGDEGFPAVFAVNGEIMDNVTVRVKGNQARTNFKRKWKVMLPAGYQWDMGGLLVEPIDEFDLLPAATDKSYSREILTADMQALSGGVFQQVFPVRVEKNSEFFGLYMYGESSDANWRDKIGLSADSIVYKAEKVASLKMLALDYPPDVFRTYYERFSQTYVDKDDELRALITTLGTLKGDDLIRFAYEHLDIPQVIEAIATMRIVQHAEWQSKNYFVVFDPVDERWRLLPIDFDLNFGRRYASPCNARCDVVKADPWMEYPDGNRLAGIFLNSEHFRILVDRRTRTLADEFLAPDHLETRLSELFALMEVDAEMDRLKWGQYGESQSLAEAQQILHKQYNIPKRSMYLESGKYLPPAQSNQVELIEEVSEQDTSGQVLRGVITNTTFEAVDVSGRVFEKIGAILPAGVVIPPLGSLEVVFDRAPVTIAAETPVDQLRLVVSAKRWSADDE
jgi:hypothetical protein